MATSQPENNQSNTEPWTKQVVCRYFVHGICKNGDSCRYSHDLNTPPNMVCRYYQNGHCSYGDRCRYDHIRTEKQTKVKDDTVRGSSASESKVFNSGTNNTDWVNAAEFVPGKQYAVRTVSSYSAALQEGLESSTDVLPASSTPSKVDEICPYALNGDCINGDNCAFVHGLMCDMCGLYILHPNDTTQQEKHKEDCVKYHEEEMKESFKIAESKEATCGICMEVVWEKSDVSKRKFGILENCNHMFCLECIRKWRSAKAFKNKVVKACPQCRVSSAFVTPSDTWVEDEEEKKKLIQGYKEHLSAKPCRYFNQGKGKCPFGANCFYLHAYPDGTKQDRSKIKEKRVVGRKGSETLNPYTIWDFVEGHDDSVFDVHQSLMEIFRDDLDLFDVMYLLGDDTFSSEDDSSSSDFY